MQRRHFEAIARTLAGLQPDSAHFEDDVRRAAAQVQWRNTVRSLANTLSLFNAGFSRERFFKACGHEE